MRCSREVSFGSVNDVEDPQVVTLDCRVIRLLETLVGLGGQRFCSLGEDDEQVKAIVRSKSDDAHESARLAALNHAQKHSRAIAGGWVLLKILDSREDDLQ